MAHNFSLRSYSCIASPPSSSPSSSSVVVSEISKVLRPLPLPLPLPLCYCLCYCPPCCTSGLRRMMSSRAGPSSSVFFRLVQPRSYSDACPVPLGRPRNYRIKKSKYCEVLKNFIYFRLDLLRGASIIV